MDLRLDLPCDREAPATVRHVLTDCADAVWAIGDVMLVASELVTNAVRHSNCEHDDTVSVELRSESEAIVCSVSDPGRSGRVAAPVPEHSLFGGFGLRVVEQLASRWGAAREQSGRYRVWAEVPVRAAA